jgi:hypothetical protein
MPIRNINLYPNKSPRRPAKRMKVPTVKLYPAMNQANSAGLSTSNECPMTFMIGSTWPRPASESMGRSVWMVSMMQQAQLHDDRDGTHA